MSRLCRHVAKVGIAAVVAAVLGGGPAHGATRYILYEWWDDYSGTDNALLTTNSPSAPTGTELRTSFEGPRNRANNYGSRMRGYIHPPANGDYTFFLCSDDQSQLWLSSDDTPGSIAMIAEEDQYQGWDEWSVSSAPRTLVGGQKYYVEVVHREGAVGDHVRVGWLASGIVDEKPISGQYLSPWVEPDTAPVILSTAPRAAYLGYEYRYEILAFGNPEPDLATDYTLTNDPTGGVLSITDNVLTGTGWTDAAGTLYTAVAVTVTNTAGPTTQTFDITLSGADPGMLAWWKLDETAGTTAADSTFLGHDGTLTNMDAATDWVVQVTRSGLDFDGVDDYVETGKTASQIGIDGNKPRTVALWCYTGTFNDGALFLVGDDNTAEMFSLRTMSTDDTWRIQYWDDDYDFALPSKDAWVHFALTHDGTYTKLYANGTLIVDWSKTLSTSDTGTFVLGDYYRGTDHDYYHGVLSDVRVYDRALSQADVRAAMGDAAPVVYSLPMTVAPANEPYTYTVEVMGNPDATVSVNDLSAFPWITWDAGTQTLSGTPDDTDVGTPVSVVVTATNGIGTDATQTFTIDVVDKASSLVLHWELEEGGGPTFADSSTSGDDNVGQEDEIWMASQASTAVIGTAMHLDGWGYVRAQDSGSLRLQKFTIALWCRPDMELRLFNFDTEKNEEATWSTPQILRRYSNDGGYILGNLSHGNTMGLRIRSGSDDYQISYDEPGFGQWMHVVGVYDGNELRLYRDAVLMASKQIGPVTITYGFTTFNLGYDGYEGDYDDIRVYAWPLDGLDILDLYNTDPSLPTAAPTITTAPRTQAYVDRPYSYTFGVTGKPTPTTIDVTGLPTWLQYDGGLTISGTPAGTDAGVTGTITITVSNGETPDAVQEFEIGVSAIDPDMIAWWRLDETSGTVAREAISGDDGFLQGFPGDDSQWVTGTVGGALEFDGTDHVELPPSLVNTDLGSVSFWFNSSQTLAAPAIVWYGAEDTGGNGFGGNKEMEVHFDGGGELQLFIDGGDDPLYADAGTGLADGQWHHLAATWDRAALTAEVYVDGALVDTASPSTAWNSFVCSAVHRLGSPSADQRRYIGLIDDVRIYGDVITDIEVGDLHKNTVVTVSATDGTEGTTDATITVTRTTTGDDYTDTLTVDISVVEDALDGTIEYAIGTVTGGTVDFVAGTVGFDSGSSSVVITIGPTNDAVPEAPETISLALLDYQYPGDDYVVGTPREAVATINDDDVPGTFNLTDPADGTRKVALPTTLTWEQPGTPAAESYTLTVATDQALSSILLEEAIPDPATVTRQIDVADGFDDNMELWWTVTAHNIVGDAPAANGPFHFWTPDTIGPKVSDLQADGTLLPDATLELAPSAIVVTFGEDVDEATVSGTTFLLVGSGDDGTFTDGNEVSITPASVSVTATAPATDEVTIDLTGVRMPNDTYQLTIVSASGVADMVGNELDGEYNTSLPSGDGEIGGDFVCTFVVADPLPEVSTFSPSGSSANISATVKITFSEEVFIEAPTAIEDVFSIERPDGSEFPGDWVMREDDRAVTFTPARDFAYETTYTVTIVSTLLVDSGGNQLDGDGDGVEGDDYVGTFKTWERLTGLGIGGGCMPGAPLGEAWLAAALLALALRRRRS